MKESKLWIDINAHVANITCYINIDSTGPTATISFDNLGTGAITAIKFNATGYDSFGDVIQVNNRNQFFLIIQDIHIPKNSSAKGLKAKMPNSNMRKLVLEESQICYADGTLTTYMGSDIREFDVEEYTDHDKSGEIYAALKDRFGEKLFFRPKVVDDGWICGCGRFNSLDKTMCSCCNNKKSDIFQVEDDDAISKIVSDFLRREDWRKEYEQQAAKEKEKEEKKPKIVIVLGVVIVGVIMLFIGQVTGTSGRTAYATEAEMKAALQGKYTYYVGDVAKKQIEIKGNQCRYIYQYVDSGSWANIRWFPEKGKLYTFENIIVTSNGSLKVGGELYQKGGYLPSDDDDTDSLENGYSVLEITVDGVSHETSYTVCTGSVKNTGNKTYRFITLKGSFQDASGTVIANEWVIPYIPEGLASGKSVTFRFYVTKNSNIDSCSVSLHDFKEEGEK